MSTYMRERVARGAAALDQIDPLWFRKVNLGVTRFDISCSEKCVLGQLYGNMYSRRTPLTLIENADKFGFDLKCRKDKNWLKLHKAWLTEIKARCRQDDVMISKAVEVCLSESGFKLLEQVIRGGEVGPVVVATAAA